MWTTRAHVHLTGNGVPHDGRCGLYWPGLHERRGLLIKDAKVCVCVREGTRMGHCWRRDGEGLDNGVNMAEPTEGRGDSSKNEYNEGKI